MSKAEKTPHARRFRLPQLDWRRRAGWFAAEFLVVVSGILVALALNAWWAERSDRESERDLLIGLRAEFVVNRSLYDRTANRHRLSIEQARRMLEWTGPTPADVDPAEVDSLLFPLISELSSFHPAMGEVEAMMSSGQLALVRNDSLRTALAAWPGALALLKETENEMREDVMRGFFPYVLKRVPFLTMDKRVGFIDTLRPSRFEQDYAALLSDVAFENHVENRWVMAIFILEDGEPVRKLMNDIIRLIDVELGEAADARGTRGSQ